MKKRNICLIIILFLVVGCRSQSLSCTKVVMDTDEVVMDERISLTFKKRQLTDCIYSLNYTFANNIDDNVATTRSSLEDQYSVYKDKKGVDYSFSNIEQGLHFQLQLKESKLTEEDKENFSNLIDYKTIQSAKEELIKEGYHCK